MLVTEQEIEGLRNLVCQLNRMRDAAVLVEGKRDAAALEGLGFSGTILQLCRFGGMVGLADHAARYGNVVVLFDRDRKGRHLTARAVRLLARRTNLDLSFKRRLGAVTRGKIMFTEQLRCYEKYVD